MWRKSVFESAVWILTELSATIIMRLAPKPELSQMNVSPRLLGSVSPEVYKSKPASKTTRRTQGRWLK